MKRLESKAAASGFKKEVSISAVNLKDSVSEKRQEVSGKLREKELPERSHLYLSYEGKQGKELTSVTVEG